MGLNNFDYPEGEYSDEDLDDMLSVALSNCIMKGVLPSDFGIVVREDATLDIMFDDDVTERSRDLYYEYLSYEPDAILNALARSDVCINIVSSGEYTGNSAGSYDTDFEYMKDININCSTDNRLKISVNHEIGHCVDELLGHMCNIDYSSARNQPVESIFISNCDEFQDIYEIESVGSGYNSHCCENSAEFFAETYRYIVEDNSDMLSRVPRSKEFISDVVNKAYGTSF